MRSRAQRATFDEPNYFDYVGETKRWRCNACTPSPALAQRNGMTTKAAVKHEKTAEHRNNVRAREEWNPPQDSDAWVNVADDRIDQVRDFIPFWRRTIEAAEYGETLRFEDFLNAIRKGQEKPGWDMPVPGWGSEPSEPLDVEQLPRGVDYPQGLECERDRDREAFNFVERVAKMNAADPERKKRLHSFYKIPTSEKVKRINELIEVLRKTQGTS